MASQGGRLLASKGKNGVGAFVLQCRKIVFNYCEHWGSNRGMLDYIHNDLARFAREHPQIECVVQPRPGHHPLLRASYLNGREKQICVRNLKPSEIDEKVALLRDSSGNKQKLLTKRPVISTTPSVRGQWSPFLTKPHEI